MNIITDNVIINTDGLFQTWLRYTAAIRPNPPPKKDRKNIPVPY